MMPADLKELDLVKAFKIMGQVNGVFEIQDSSSNITATDLIWKHCTELKMEML